MLITLAHQYEQLWRKETSDSPESSQLFVAHRVTQWMQQNLENGGDIVDLGSGPQPIEKELVGRMKSIAALRGQTSKKQFSILTVDFAPIPQQSLVKSGDKIPFNIMHLQNDLTQLDIQDGFADFVFSNHAIDFAPRDAFAEASRILKPGGEFLFLFHHPNLWRNSDMSRLSPEVIEFWRDLEDRGQLFETEQGISETLTYYGLPPTQINLVNQRVHLENETYWIASGVKSSDAY
jgi:SAM-dependent methyltransferase